MKRIVGLVLASAVFALSLVGCASTQKTGGAGLSSVVAQNVVRVAGERAMQEADLSAVKGKMTFIRLTGFVDDRNKGFLDNLVRSRAEDAGARLVSEDKANVIMEVVINSAGNDWGDSKVPLLSHSERTEGAVDLDIIMRNPADGTKISTQHVRGDAKYEQSTVIGITGSGGYFVKDKKGQFVEVESPTSYR